MRELHCTRITENHSADTATMYVGRPAPLVVCGYHASRLTGGGPDWKLLTDERLPLK